MSSRSDLGQCLRGGRPWSSIGRVNIKPWDDSKVLQVKRVEWASETKRNSSNEAVEDANAMAQMELLKPLLGFYSTVVICI